MKRTRLRSILTPLLATALLSAHPPARAADFKREVVYQIITDRFFDGSAANNNPPQSAGLYDAARANWRAYWGGDLEGVRQKMPYLAGLGVTAIWISPPVDNLNANIADGSGNPTASYHGYQARDFKRLEEHFGDGSNGWAAFDALVAAAHRHGIKVIVDFAPNHSTQDDAGEFGALYDDGALVARYPDDKDGYFHHNGNISGDGWDDRYRVQYQTLFNLADLNQEHPRVDAYLKSAARLFQRHGADGFRLDAVKHTNWGWQYSLANSVYTEGDSFVFGEWYQTGASDPLYRDSYKFANRSGVALLDFPLNAAVRNVFGAANAGFSEIESVITREAHDFTWDKDLITFVDNHDMTRFLSLNNNRTRLHQALAFILTSRGIPCVYYGTEQYLHNNTSGGGDPYNRPMMSAFDTSTTAYTLTGRLSALRRNNAAVPYGSHRQRWINPDVYIYERKFYGNVVLVAINKGAAAASITGLNTSLPAGAYGDYLAGLLSGVRLTVGAGAGGDNPAAAFSLPAGGVAVWQATEAGGPPQAGSVGPVAAQPGVKVTVGGKNFGAARGAVKFGTTAATIVSWSPTKVVATVPKVTGGDYALTVTNSSNQTSNAVRFTALTAKLVPVTFTVHNASPTRAGDHIFLTGNTVELGNWSATWEGAVGPMLAPNYPHWFLCASVPAGAKLQFKFIKIAADGAVTWEGGANHTYTVPASGAGFVNVNWQN